MSNDIDKQKIEDEIEEPGRREKAKGIFNEGIDGLLSSVLETRTRVAVYVGLRKLGDADEEDIARETGIYPDKVENTLYELMDDEIVVPVGDKYRAISPTELVKKVPDRFGEVIEELLEDEPEFEDEEGTRIEVE